MTKMSEQPKKWKWWQRVIGILRKFVGGPAGAIGEAGADAGWWPSKKGKP